MCLPSSQLIKIRQAIVELKSEQNTQADSAKWHRLTIDLGDPTTSYDTAYLHKIRVVPKNGLDDNLLIYPTLSPGQTRWHWSAGGYSSTQYSSIGRVQYSFDDQKTLYVVNNTYVGGMGDAPTVIKKISLTIYSNHALELIENSKTLL